MPRLSTCAARPARADLLVSANGDRRQPPARPAAVPGRISGWYPAGHSRPGGGSAPSWMSAQVCRISPGDRVVYACHPPGAYAALRTLAAEPVVRLPAGVPGGPRRERSSSRSLMADILIIGWRRCAPRPGRWRWCAPPPAGSACCSPPCSRRGARSGRWSGPGEDRRGAPAQLRSRPCQRRRPDHRRRSAGSAGAVVPTWSWRLGGDSLRRLPRSPLPARRHSSATARRADRSALATSTVSLPGRPWLSRPSLGHYAGRRDGSAEADGYSRWRGPAIYAGDRSPATAPPSCRSASPAGRPADDRRPGAAAGGGWTALVDDAYRQSHPEW